MAYALFVAAVSPTLVVALDGQPAATRPLIVAQGEVLADFQTLVSIGTVIAVTARTGPLGFLGSVLEFAGTSSYLLGGTGLFYVVAGFLLVFGGGITWTYSLREYVLPRSIDNYVDDQLAEDDDDGDDERAAPDGSASR